MVVRAQCLCCPGSSPGAFQAVPSNSAGSSTLFEGHALDLLTISLPLYFADTNASNNTTLYWIFASKKRHHSCLSVLISPSYAG